MELATAFTLCSLLASIYPSFAEEYRNADPEVACSFLANQIRSFARLRDAGYSEAATLAWGIEHANNAKGLRKGSKLATDIKSAMATAADMVYNKIPWSTLSPEAGESRFNEQCPNTIQWPAATCSPAVTGHLFDAPVALI